MRRWRPGRCLDREGLLIEGNGAECLAVEYLAKVLGRIFLPNTLLFWSQVRRRLRLRGEPKAFPALARPSSIA